MIHETGVVLPRREIEMVGMVAAVLAVVVGAGLWLGHRSAMADEPAPAHQAFRYMDGIPVLTPDSGVVCVTAAIQVADTVVPEYVVGDSVDG